MSDPQRLPPAIRFALVFEVVNAASWSVILGAPLLLFLKSHDASATALGVAAAAAPLLQVLQPLGARLMPRYGYRGLMIRGWNVRTFLTLLVAVLALASPWLAPSATVLGTLALVLGFCVIRGLTCGGWLPWMTQLVPGRVRGRFLAAATGCVQGSVILCQIGYATVLEQLPGSTGFAVLFLWSCLTGWGAAWVMARIPDAPVSAEGGIGPVPWRELLRHPPFRALLRFDLLAWTAMAGAGVFWIPVLRDLHQQGDGFIALMPVWASGAGLASLWFLGRALDRAGSKPLLAVALVLVSVHLALWALLAAKWLPLSLPVLCGVQITGGIAFTAFGLANTRLLMTSVPGQGSSHFFALHGATFAIGQGVMPILWGVVLDWCLAHGGATWTVPAHAWLYGTMAVLTLCAFGFHRQLQEPSAQSTGDFLAETLWHMPTRTLARLVPSGWFGDRGG